MAYLSILRGDKTVDNDLISRKALKEFIMQNGYVYANTLDTFPAVDPHEHGRWEQCFEDWRRQIEGDKCTACGFEHYGSCINYYHYCPNCGAFMGG